MATIPQSSGVVDLVDSMINEMYGSRLAELEKRRQAPGSGIDINEKINAELPAYVAAQRESVIQSLMAPALRRAEQLRKQAEETRKAKLGDAIQYGLINVVLNDEDSAASLPARAAEILERKAAAKEADARANAERAYKRKPEYRGLEDQFVQQYMNTVIAPIESQYREQGEAFLKDRSQLYDEIRESRKSLFEKFKNYPPVDGSIQVAEPPSSQPAPAQLASPAQSASPAQPAAPISTPPATPTAAPSEQSQQTPAETPAPQTPPNFTTPSAPKVVRAPRRATSDLTGRASVVDAPQQPGLIGGAGLLAYTPTMNAPANNVGLLLNQNPQLYNLNASGVRLPGQGV